VLLNKTLEEEGRKMPLWEKEGCRVGNVMVKGEEAAEVPFLSFQVDWEE
jgi:hypothetical protein